MRCAHCGHLHYDHDHYRRGTDCALCSCMRYVHPVPAWLRHVKDRVTDRWRRA